MNVNWIPTLNTTERRGSAKKRSIHQVSIGSARKRGKSRNIKFPPFIKVIDDVTNKNKHCNSSLAKNKMCLEKVNVELEEFEENGKYFYINKKGECIKDCP